MALRGDAYRGSRAAAQVDDAHLMFGRSSLCGSARASQHRGARERMGARERTQEGVEREGSGSAGLGRRAHARARPQA